MNDYKEFYEQNKTEILKSALDAIDPDKIGMDRKQALTLVGAMRTCGFDESDVAAVFSRSVYDKGLFAEQYANGKFTGKGQNGTAGEGSIIYFARLSGWNFPSPYDFGYASMKAAGANKQTSPAPSGSAAPTDQDKEHKIYVHLDTGEYKTKPINNAWEIRKREKTDVVLYEEYTLQQFAEGVLNGRSFYPTVYKKTISEDKKGNKQSNYEPIGAYLLIADIDNEEPVKDENGKNLKDENGKQLKKRIDKPLSPEGALEICRKNGLEPFLIYETFSSKLHRDDPKEPYKKFRVCVALDASLKKQEHGEKGIRLAIKKFIGLFGNAADQNTTDPARLIFGTDEKESAYFNNSVVSIETIEQLIYKSDDPEEQQGQQVAPVSNFIDLFEQHRKEFNSNIRTGFLNLDIALGGGFSNELYVMGADTGTGKSAIASVLAQKIAESGTDVLYYALEMGRDEFIARGASAISYELSQNKFEKPVTKIMFSEILNDTYDYEQQAFFRRSYDQYADFVGEYVKRYGEHLYIIEGGVERVCATDIVNTVNEFKKTHKVKRLAVFVDYLQLLRADPDDKTQRDQMSVMSAAVIALKSLASQQGATVFLISSMANDKKGRGVTDVSFKYSGDIGYTGGVLLGWNWKGVTDESKEEERLKVIDQAKSQGFRKMSLEVLKHRNGERNNKLHLRYYPAYNYIEEDFYET